MENTDNQTPIDYRGRLVDRMRSQYPDRNFDESNENGVTNDFDRSISESFDQYDQRLKESEESNERLTNLFRTNPRAASFLGKWAETGSPALAFRKIYGANAFEKMQSEEGAAMIAEIEAEEEKQRNEDAAFQQEKEDNLQKSFDAFDEILDAKGFNDNQKIDFFEKLRGFAVDATKGIYSKEFINIVYDGMHYADDVASARHEGEVDGRNARIKEMQRQRNQSSALPPALSGQGGTVNEGGRKPGKWSDYL